MARTVLDLLKANWKPIGAVSLVTAIYLVSKFFPEASLEQAYLQNIATVLGITLIPMTPALKKPGGDA